MTQKEFELLYSIKKNGSNHFRKLKEAAKVSLGYVSETIRRFKALGWVDENGITESGLAAISPYKVNNVILLSEECPYNDSLPGKAKAKGLCTEKGEVSVERLIEQIQQAGIPEIILVLGYQKEAFFYLENKYQGIKIRIDSEYVSSGNTYAVYLARNYVSNSYICFSGQRFEQNPFEEYVYQSYLAGSDSIDGAGEWFATKDRKGQLNSISNTASTNCVLFGFSYWDKQFSEQLLDKYAKVVNSPRYKEIDYRQFLAETITLLPPVQLKVFSKAMRSEEGPDKEDRGVYALLSSNPEILKNIASTLCCNEYDIVDMHSIKEGLTNISFSFSVYGERYVYRHPGEGTSAIISREHEKKALELAKKIGVDTTYIHMDSEQGWKISRFVEGIRIPAYGSFSDSVRVLNVMRTLHQKKLHVDWSFLPWEETCKIEGLIKEKRGQIVDKSYSQLKEAVNWCYTKCINDGVEMCFCHCDTYAPNWMLTDKETILIDWEYAGYADPGCDIGTYIMDSCWEVEDAVRFINEYCKEEGNKVLTFHYLAYTAILSFYWYTWALYREACGAVMGESLYNWHMMAERYSNYLLTNKEYRE